MKKKDVKPIVEATLAVLGRALAEGEELNVPPMGKIKVNREKHLPNARMMIVKIRQPHANAPGPAKDPLADGDDYS